MIRFAADTFSGWLRLGLNVARFWLGYLRRVRPAIKRGSLVVGDRWAYGYLAQPVPLKFFGPEWLARAAVRLMPQPDLVVRLTAPASVIRSRKAELTEQQIEKEHALWGLITARRILEVDARRTPGEIAEVVLSALQPAPDT